MLLIVYSSAMGTCSMAVVFSYSRVSSSASSYCYTQQKPLEYATCELSHTRATRQRGCATERGWLASKFRLQKKTNVPSAGASEVPAPAASKRADGAAAGPDAFVAAVSIACASAQPGGASHRDSPVRLLR